MSYAKEIMETASYIKDQIAAIPELFILGMHSDC